MRQGALMPDPAGQPLSAAEVERGYNNRAAVPDYEEWLSEWRSLSAAARQRLDPPHAVQYGSGPRQALDLFLPDGESRGTFLFIHGGFWCALDKADYLFVAAPLVAQGCAVAMINYDLCPAVPIASIVDQCRQALAWIVKFGAGCGANTQRIVAGGHSAGGHLAAMLLATPAAGFATARHPLAGVISISGIHDLRPLTLYSMNRDLGLDDASASEVSPALLAPQGEATVLVAVGRDETSEFHRQASLLWHAWPRNRPPAMTGPLVVGKRHHLSIVGDYLDAGSALTRASLSLF